jgi:sortase A
MTDETHKHNHSEGALRTTWGIVALVGMAVGLALILYPLISNWVVSAQRHQEVQTMTSTYSDGENPVAQEALAQADLYNKQLADEVVDGDVLPYDEQLSQVYPYMAYVVCPKINLEMPIYHGTDDASLTAGVGHVDTTSLPVGGETSNCVISAHSGSADAAYFDDIRQLEVGDLFAIECLGRECVYEVDSIDVISQDDQEAWNAATSLQPGEDTCLLVTCTPYGVNDHRLLVRGVRTTKSLDQTAESGVEGISLNRRTAPALAGVAVLIAALVLGQVASKHRNNRAK